MIILSMDKIAKTDIFVTGKWSFFIQIARAFPIIFGKKWNEKSCKRKSNPAKLFSKMFHKNLFFFFLIGYLPITNFSAYEEVLNCIQQHLPNSIPNTRYTIPRLSSFINCISYLRCYFELLLNDTFQFNTLHSQARWKILKYIHNTIIIIMVYVITLLPFPE